MGVERRAGERAAARYRPRRPSQSVLYRCVQEHLETWLAQCGDSHDDEGSVPEHIERDFRRYLECGVLAHGLARARCGQCGHDFLIAFSRKGRGVRPSCITQRMVATAAIDGVFDAAAAGGIIFTAATGVDANAIAQVQSCVRRRLLRVFVRRGLLPGDCAQAMAQWEHGGGFSVDGSVRVEAADRAGRERLLRYCAWPPLALNRLHELDPQRLLYEVTKPCLGGNGLLLLTPLQLLDRLAALVPPSRIATVTSAC